MQAIRDQPWLQSTTSRENLRFLAYYFAVVTLCMSVLMYAFTAVWQFHLPTRTLWTSLPLHLILTTITFVLAVKRVAIKEPVTLGLLLLSVAIMALFLYDTGGHTNPLISLLLLPLAMSAATLSWPSTLLLALAAIGVYSTLTQFYITLEGHGVHTSHEQHEVMHIHLVGMWLTFAVSASVILGLVTPMARSMRRQRELIALQQEKILRDERLVALATFAASAAHQLGTPLSTLMVITEDLKESLADRSDLMPDLDVMQQQIGVCKQTLHGIMRRADTLRFGEPILVTLDTWLNGLRHQFNLLNPSRSLRIPAISSSICQILQDDTLDQAILNLLDNAARASNQDPHFEIQLEPQQVTLRIIDSGPGVPEAIRHQLGKPFVSARTDGSGMGLGLFLSHATINRFGGTLSLHSGTQGTITEIKLPRADSRQQVATP